MPVRLQRALLFSALFACTASTACTAGGPAPPKPGESIAIQTSDFDGGVKRDGGDASIVITGADAETAPDAEAFRDAAAADAAAEDANEHDAGARDAQPIDMGVDGGRLDAGQPDAGGNDAGITDAQVAVPLIDMGSNTYWGHSGGLYPNHSSAMPNAHANDGASIANTDITPRDSNGVASAMGRIVLMSIGMSNTTQEFCSANGMAPCSSWSFMGQAAADPSLDSAHLTILNGAFSSRTAVTWDSPTDPDYDRVRDTVLTPAGLSEQQVQIVWLKVANGNPMNPLPANNADAYALERSLGNILRAMKVRYPNLVQTFISSRAYAGYANTPLNPEPFAYESGFAVKWIVEAQIQLVATGTTSDPRAGDVDYTTGTAPWIAWGPYFWADGATPRSDGLTWDSADFESDGTHPSMSGETKIGDQLLDFFSNSPVTRCWFHVNQTCP